MVNGDEEEEEEVSGGLPALSHGCCLDLLSKFHVLKVGPQLRAPLGSDGPFDKRHLLRQPGRALKDQTPSSLSASRMSWG